MNPLKRMLVSVIASVTLGLAGPAAAAGGFTLTLEPAASIAGGSFTAVLRGSVPGDFLLSLDSVADFDANKLSFTRYETAGTLTQGFTGPSLTSTFVSLIENGTPATTFDGVIVRALFVMVVFAGLLPALGGVVTTTPEEVVTLSTSTKARPLFSVSKGSRRKPH